MQTIKRCVLFGVILLLIVFSCKEGNRPKLFSKKVESEGFTELSSLPLEELIHPKSDAATQEILQNFYQYFWEGNDLWGEFLVARGDQVFIEKYRGFSNLKDSTPIQSHTPIHLASISKNMTAMVILKMIEKKKLKLHQSVSSILKDFPYPEITVFDLLTHRSGLGNYDYFAELFEYTGEGKPLFTNKRMYKMFAECQPSLLFKPNTQHSYCNTNYAFLALIVEQITGDTFPNVMKKWLFEPLEMKDSYVFTKANQDTATLSYYYSKKPWKWNDFDYIYGDKNVYSTARDLFNYSQAMFTSEFLPKALMDSAMKGYSYERAGVKNYGLGFRIREYDNNKKIIFHTGLWHGNNTLFMHLPDEQLTIISLGNKSSKANYAAFSLVSVFGDYPLSLEGEDQLLTMSEDEDQDKMDSLMSSSKEKWEKDRELKAEAQAANSNYMEEPERVQSKPGPRVDSIKKKTSKPKVDSFSVQLYKKKIEEEDAK